MSGTLNQGIRDFIVNTFLFGEGGDDISDDDSLLAKGIVDSTGVLELVAYLEETHGLQVSDQELVADNFDSINKLVAFIKSKLS